MRVYLDTCCLSRLSDSQDQERVRAEATAIDLILAQVRAGTHFWLSSAAIEREIQRIPDAAKRETVVALHRRADLLVALDAVVLARAGGFVYLGFDTVDAAHLAAAETGGADVFLTVDDRLIRCARRHVRDLNLRVRNPVDWLEEG